MLLSSGTMDTNVVSNVPRIMASLEDLPDYMCLLMLPMADVCNGGGQHVF